MNKKELIDATHKAMCSESEYKHPHILADRAVNGVLNAIESQLAKGNKVVIAGFGTFSVKDRAARLGRNPSTGEAIEIAASKAVKFSPGKNLKENVK